MIVLFNITCKPKRTIFYERPNIKTDDRLDVFKYCIASHAVMNPLVTKYLFYITLDPEYQPRKKELECFIRDNIDDDKLQITWKANETLEEWHECTNLISLINDNTLYYLPHEDHIFIDYDLSALYFTVKEVEKDSNPFSAMFYSHWPELIKVASRNGATLSDSGYSVRFDWSVHDSIRLLRKELWIKHWYDWDYKDMPGSTKIPLIKKFLPDDLNVSCHIPTRELCRHYDGYSHVGNLLNWTPPIEIPQGFFQKTILIKYAYKDLIRNSNIINVNPCIPNLKSADSTLGVDYKFTFDRLPLFWQGRIAEININEECNPDEIEECYNSWFLQTTKQKMGTYCMHFDENDSPPDYWFAKNLNTMKRLRYS